MSAANKLDFEQRRRAVEIEEAIDPDNAYELAAEVVLLRDAAKLAAQELETFEREMSGIAPEAKSKALPMLRDLLGGECPNCGFDKRGCGCSPSTK